MDAQLDKSTGVKTINELMRANERTNERVSHVEMLATSACGAIGQLMTTMMRMMMQPTKNDTSHAQTEAKRVGTKNERKDAELSFLYAVC